MKQAGGVGKATPSAQSMQSCCNSRPAREYQRDLTDDPPWILDHARGRRSPEPAARTMSGHPVTSASLRINPSIEAGERARFLIVDDEPALLRAMRRVLNAAGPDWAVVCARHGVEALECLSNEPFDAVVLDLHMPVMDGLTLLRHLVAEYPEVRRIVHSSHIDPTRLGILAELAHEVLAKPVPPEQIIDALERSLQRRSDPAAPQRPAAARGTPTC